MRNPKSQIVCLLLCMPVFYFGQDSCLAQQDGNDIAIGTYRVAHSQILNEDRLLFIHLPQEYGETNLSYPVLYIPYVDLYDYFADAVIITEKLAATGVVPPLILVGVANTNRYRDLLPVANRSGEGGGADTFIRVFEEELIPFVDRNYRTKDFRILAGPQAAAVFGLYTLITKSSLFDAFILDNPFGNPENAAYLYPRAEQFFKDTEILKNFLYIKCEKNERPQNLKTAEEFALFLESEKPEGLRFHAEFREPSGYFIPPVAFKEGLKTFFASYPLPGDFQRNTIQDILGYYSNLSTEYGFQVDLPSRIVFEGVRLNQEGKTGEAIQVFETMLALYPGNLNALFQLAETCRGIGELEKARDFYKRFLAIRDVDASMIHTRLDQVEKAIAGSAAYRIEQEIRKGGIRAGLKKYREIRSDPQNIFYFDEAEFNAMGYRILAGGKIKDAIEIFKLNTELHPESANAFDSLAGACMKSGDKKNAIQYYKKSLELNPNNTNAKEMLKQLENK